MEDRTKNTYFLNPRILCFCYFNKHQQLIHSNTSSQPTQHYSENVHAGA